MSSVLNVALCHCSLIVGERAMSAGRALKVEDLIETDDKIIDQVRRSLSQSYLNIMSRALHAGRQAEARAAKPNSPGN